jgi:serine O-acetyltransferase
MSPESLSVERLPPVATASRERYSASVPDWSREAKSLWSWSPSRSLLASLRLYQRVADSKHPWHALLRKVAVLQHRFWSIVTAPTFRSAAGSAAACRSRIRTVSSSMAMFVLGPNCLIFQQVTIGANESGVPTIGGQVDFGAGAKVIGPVKIGDHALIGANAVVVCDVPAWATAVGVPARVLPRRPEQGS